MVGVKMISKILVPVDGSTHSDKALEYAVFLAKACRASLGVVHVSCPPPISFSDNERGSYLESLKADANTILTKAKNNAKAAGVAIEAISELGHPAARILEVAGNRDYDLIVIGSRGISGFKEAVLGSVSHSVSQHAKCAVLIVH
jgi:nucleotide-binding universal stress UspA family protein